ncbi:GD20073 [Drosophila simulans]|uniref:Odorant receptor n=1 Tax=Drosophila simulans TaxID=7240 RepID=B4QS49_DROSI|nr:GD20073 [Drosophila simulans]
MKYLLSMTLLLAIGLQQIDAHGMMLSPPSRSSRWRYDGSAPQNWNDNELFCGGLYRCRGAKESVSVVEDFLMLATKYFYSIGVVPYESDEKPRFGLHLYLGFHVANLLFVWFTMMVFVVNSVRDNEDFLKISMVVGYITFGNVGVLKILVVQLQKRKLTSLVQNLKSLFPQPNKGTHEDFDVEHYLRFSKLISKYFGRLYVAMIVINSASSITQYAIQRWWLHSANVELTLPYVPLAPWNWRGSWTSWPTYLLQSTAAYTCTCGCLSADLMMFAVVMQVIMHFDRLAKALREFDKRCSNGAEEDLNELRSLIVYHNQVLRLTSKMNDIFGVPLLLNFLNSSMLICNVGFQLTIGISLEYIGRQVLIILSALVEVYLICSLSQMLINASKNVSLAVYDMDWLEYDTKFRKMLVLVVMRAQKPVSLNAKAFLSTVSMGTMTTFMQVSYKFFCAIRMMYQ